MKNIVLVLTALVFVALTQAQDSWTISYGKKTMLKKVTENRQKNIVNISQASLKTNAKLTIQLFGADTANNVTLMANLDNGNNVKEWEYSGKLLSIPADELKTLFGKNSKLEFFYRSIPKDPAIAAVVRIRPVHICNVTLK